ncbi:hypothetical protein JB92DRAFT_3133763 [Gautieria morchelliformis]|nr:hypothetical protein JB92DRAFT_3133763 [Gautieria morchelliformis]
MDIEVDDGVDIGVVQLRNYLNEHPALPPLVNVGEDPTVMKKAAGSAPTPQFETHTEAEVQE